VTRPRGIAVGRVPAPAAQAAPPLIPAGELAGPLVIRVSGRPAPQGSHVAFPLWAGPACARCGQRKLIRVVVKDSAGKYLEAWRGAVTAAARVAMLTRGGPLAGPLAASMVLTLRRPASGDHQHVPDGPPDLSKLIRSTEDALTDAAAITDDARIVWLDYAGKTYPGNGMRDELAGPGAVIRLRRAD
jgi:Holliday junction resolvase RusA-like endonuclease